jgi:dTDP-4-dehydrorhamnose 3,5-epimerase
MEVLDLPLPGLKLIKPRVFQDDRGFFLESYRKDALARSGVEVDFVQDNHSRSVRNTVRGLHLQRASGRGPGQAKLVRVVSGKVFDVAVDLRPESPSFGKWHGEVIDAQAHHELYIPVGFAHGFCVLSDTADVIYKVSSYYDAETETGFAFDDQEVGVAWPVARPQALLSQRDQQAQSFRALMQQLQEHSR